MLMGILPVLIPYGKLAMLPDLDLPKLIPYGKKCDVSAELYFAGKLQKATLYSI